MWITCGKMWINGGRKLGEKLGRQVGRLGGLLPEALVATLAVDNCTGQVRHWAYTKTLRQRLGF